MKFFPEDPVTILAFLSEFRNLANANRVNQRAGMHAFQYLSGEPAKSSFSERIVPLHVHDDVDDYELVDLTTYWQVIHTLLDMYVQDEVIAEADTALWGLKMKPRKDPNKFTAALMSKALRFSGV